MAKLKALPKALLVGGVIAAVGFGAYKYMPPKAPNTEVAAATTAPATPATAVVVPAPAPAPVVQAPPPPAPAPVAVAPAPEPAPNPTAAILPNQQPALESPPPVGTMPGGKLPGAGIASGQKSGTYYPMVENIVSSCSTNEYPLRNVASNGTIDNIMKVYTDPNSQFGIAQEDGLAAQAKVDAKMMSRIVAVFPFYSEEIHIVAKDGSPINSLADLEGKRVIEGSQGSGTNITVQLIKQLTGVKWQTVSGNFSQKEGLDAVRAGQADAEFIVAGQPLSMLSATSGVKLVSLQHPAMDQFGYYTPTQLPTGTYPWQRNAVPTYKVNNVLVTFAYKNQYKTEIGNLVSCITKNLDKLQSSGHPKWRDVDPLDIDRVKWPVHPSALAAIKREMKR